MGSQDNAESKRRAKKERSANKAHRMGHHKDQRCGMMNAVTVLRQHYMGRREPPEWCFKNVGQTEATSKDEHR